MQSILRFSHIAPRSLYRLASSSTASMDSIFTALKNDHASLFAAYQKYLSAKGNPDEQTRWANEFRWELARHSVGEELLVYPRFEQNLGEEGKKMADEDRAQHLEIKKLLHQLESAKVTDPNYQPTFEKLMTILTEHIKEEETEDIPKLEKTLSRDESAALAKTFERTKMFVPTRSHPNAPDKPPFETIVGLLTAPLDKLRDLFDKFPQTK